MFVQGDDCGGLAALEPWEEARTVYPLGDFYRDDDDVVRGITISTLDVPSETFDLPEFPVGGLSPAKCQYADGDGSQRCGSAVRSEVEHWEGDAALVFQESDLPPTLPESHPSVEASTLYLNSAEVPCWKVGNRLLSFLREKAVSHIKKVNKKKYTVKAQVLCSGLVCEIKVRAYRCEKEMALVVHRLGGDSIAFNTLFRMLKQDLTSGWQLPVKAEVSPEVPHVAPKTAVVTQGENAFLTPLIDAAHNADDTQAQAEAAASLAAAAEDTGTVTTALCNQKGQKAIEKLLKVNCFEVSCQVVRLILKLAVAPGAEAFLTGEGMLRLLRRKVSDLATGRMLKDQLSQTVEMLSRGHRVLCQ